MTQIVITKEFEDELDVLDSTQPDVVDAAELLIENLYDDKDLLEVLYKPQVHHFETPVFEVKGFVAAQQLGYNIYTLKFKDLEGFQTDHRIFLGFHAQKDIFYVLAITPRSYCYDTKHTAFSDLVARYQQCSIPTYT